MAALGARVVGHNGGAVLDRRIILRYFWKMGRRANPTDGFGAAVRRLRRQANWTLEDLASAAKISTSYISAIENNRVSPPRADVVRAIARALGVEVDVLIAAADSVPLAIEKAFKETPEAFYALARMTKRQRLDFAAHHGSDQDADRQREIRRLKKRLSS